MTDETQRKNGFVIDGHSFPAAPAAPGLHIVATPIGNLADITLRALQTLAGADLLLCEDTRLTARLLQRYRIATPMKPYHDHNAARQRPVIIEALQRGQSIALVSDAGTPLVSDPGYKLVRACMKADIAVSMVPGASAPVMAIALSGLPCDRFQFCGFLPPKPTARQRALSQLASVDAALIFFESAQRLLQALDDIVGCLGDRDIAVAREMTKLHEEVLRGRASEVAADLAARPALKGEITLVVAPPEPAKLESGSDEVVEALKAALETMPTGRAAAETAKRFGLPRKAVYDQAIALKAGDT